MLLNFNSIFNDDIRSYETCVLLQFIANLARQLKF